MIARPGERRLNANTTLGVKGSPVQIRPSRLVFRTLVARIGNENRQDRSHLAPAAPGTPPTAATMPLGDRAATIAGTRRPAPSRARILASRHNDSSDPDQAFSTDRGPGRRDEPTPDRPGALRAGCPRSPRTRPPPRSAGPASASRRPPRCTAAGPAARCCDPGTPGAELQHA